MPLMPRTVCLLVLLLGAAQGLSAATATTPDFTREVRPLLSRHCFKCHGPDEATRKSGLRLDVRAEATRPAKSGAVAIVPGNSTKSEVRHGFDIMDIEGLFGSRRCSPAASSSQVTQKRASCSWASLRTVVTLH